METPIKELKKAVQNMHACKAKWQESVPVKETFQGQIIWEGIVQVFKLIDHPSTNKCYAWSYLIDDPGKTKFIAVLHEGPIDSPKAAVKASIISEYHNKK